MFSIRRLPKRVPLHRCCNERADELAKTHTPDLCLEHELPEDLEQVTCSEPTVTPINSAISSRLFPRSTRVLICWILAGVNSVGLPRGKKIVAMRSTNSVIFVSPRACLRLHEHRMQPVGRLLRCGPFNPNTHVSVKMVSSRTENVSILFRDAPMPNCLSKKVLAKSCDMRAQPQQSGRPQRRQWSMPLRKRGDD